MSGREGPIGPVSSVGRSAAGGTRSGGGRPRPQGETDTPAPDAPSSFTTALEVATAAPAPPRDADPLAALEELTELHLREKGFRAALVRRRSVVEQSLVDFLS